MYDIIGDIHGHADELKHLLKKLGYEKSNGHYSHPERKAIFVGDFIDRGPKIRETLYLVKNMTDKGAAMAIMGNHEYNALCYHTQISDGEHLRKHSENNTNQHKATLDQFEDHENEWKEYLNWFRDLPVFLELKEIRVVHACWDPENIKAIPGDLRFTKEFLTELHTAEHYKKSNLYIAIDECLKGREDVMPEGLYFLDRYGKRRTEMRVKWYRDPRNCNYEEYYMEDVPDLTGKRVNLDYVKKDYFYPEGELPVFCGHYWFQGNPEVESKNIACVDYSVAKGGNLVAYRWNGEKELMNESFVWV